jgi:hypothetical protein
MGKVGVIGASMSMHLGNRLGAMNMENRPLVTDEPVEFEK